MKVSRKKVILKKIITDYVNNKGDFNIVKHCENKETLRKDLDKIIDEFCDVLAMTSYCYVSFKCFENYLNNLDKDYFEKLFNVEDEI